MTDEDKMDDKVLLEACTKGNLPRVKELLDRGCSPNGTEGALGGTPLTVSARAGHRNVVSHLIKSGADVLLKHHRSALHYALEGGHVMVAVALLNAGANINEVDDNGFSPLMWAARGGHHDIVSFLIASGADVDRVFPRQNCPSPCKRERLVPADS